MKFKLYNIDWISRTAYYGILIGITNRQGKGIGCEATHIICRYAFEALNIRKICLEVVSFNLEAKKLYEKVGFKIEGRLKKQIYLDHQFYDLIIMGLFKDRYYKLQP